MQPNPSVKTPRIMWLALLGSQCFYAVILNVPGLIEVAPVAPPIAIRFVLSALALVVAVASFVVPRLVWSSALKQTTYRAPRDAARSHDEEALRHGLRLGFVPFLLGLAMNEAIAIFGLVLGFLGEHWLFTSPFFVLAIVLMLVRFPTEETFVGPLRSDPSRPHG